MPDDESNVTAINRKAQVRRGQTPLQNALAVVLVGLFCLAAVGALVRLNLWLWLGR